MPAKNPNLGHFESKLGELEELVSALEGGEVPLEQAVNHFEKGIKLSRECETLLRQAELRVEQLSAKDADSALEDFDQESAD